MPGAIAAQIALSVRCSAAESPGARRNRVGAAPYASCQRPEPEREQRQRAVDEEVEQVDEDVFLDQEEGERGERGGASRRRGEDQRP